MATVESGESERSYAPSAVLISAAILLFAALSLTVTWGILGLTVSLVVGFRALRKANDFRKLLTTSLVVGCLAFIIVVAVSVTMPFSSLELV